LNTEPATQQPTVLYFARLGDMVMLTATLSFLHRRYHQPCQVIGAGSWNGVVFQGNPDISQFWSFGRHFPFPLTRQWPQVARALRDSHPGPIYIFEHHYRQLPRVRRMLAFSRVDPRRCVFMQQEPGTGEIHSVDRLIRLAEQTPELLQAADYPLPASSAPWAPQLRVPAEDRLDTQAWLTSQGWAGRPLVMIQPGNHRSMSWKRERWRRLNTDDKAWPIERWVELFHKIHTRLPQALIVVRGSQEEAEMLERIKAAASLEAVVTAAIGLSRLFALCEASHSMISVDTGPAHAAAALGLPLVVMYGVQEQRYWLPRSPSGSAVVGVGGPPRSVRVDQLPVSAVFEAWCSLLARTEPSQRRQHVNTTTFPQTHPAHLPPTDSRAVAGTVSSVR
jgi:ADP-heptose:LPS heptosyltransferase